MPLNEADQELFRQQQIMQNLHLQQEDHEQRVANVGLPQIQLTQSQLAMERSNQSVDFLTRTALARHHFAERYRGAQVMNIHENEIMRATHRMANPVQQYVPFTSELTAAEQAEVTRQAAGSKKKEMTGGIAARYRKRQAHKTELSQQKEQYSELSGRLKEMGAAVSAADFEVVKSQYVTESILKKKTKCGETNQELLTKARQGDYTNLEHMDRVFRNSLAVTYLRGVDIPQGATPETVVEGLMQKGGVALLMNPLLRSGISLASRMNPQDLGGAFPNSSFTNAQYKELDDLINARVMEATITTEADVTSLQKEYGCVATQAEFQQLGFFAKRKDRKARAAMLDALKRNKQSQLFMAKTMFLAQIGRMSRIDDAKHHPEIKQPWGNTMAGAFAHCSRVGIILGGNGNEAFSEKAQQSMIDSYLGKSAGLEAGFYTRGAATHTLQKKSKLRNGAAFKEDKSFNIFKITKNQRGMNVAVGGFGNAGLGGAGGQARMLKNDGTSGHIYMHYQKGDAEHYTGLLLGFESDAPGVINQTGHKHGAGNPEFASSFGGQRVDEVGDKYGGRELDVSHMNQKVLEVAMTAFESYFTKLQESQDRAAFNELVHNLCGKQMGESALQSLIRSMMAATDMSATGVTADDIITQHQGG